MAKKAQKIKNGKRNELLIVNPHAAGIDIASTEYQVCVPEDRDNEPNRRFEAYTCDLHAIARWLQQCQIEAVGMEATGIYWVQLYTVLKQYGFDVTLCNAKHLKNIGEKKTDYVDASWIQVLHSYGLLKDSFQPDNQIRQLKDLMRFREHLVQRSSQDVLRVQKALEMMNIKVHKVISNIKGKSGLAILDAIVRLDAYRFALKQIDELDQSIEQVLIAYAQIAHTPDKPIERALKSKQKQGNTFEFDAEQYSYDILGVNLVRIPGISSLTAVKFISELGNDFTSKFPTCKHFCSWLNLVPNNKISGGKVLSSKVSKRKHFAGQAFSVAANTLIHSKGYLGDYFRRMKSRLGYNQAVIALGHKLARIVFQMVSFDVEYDEEIDHVKNIKQLDNKRSYLLKSLAKVEKELALTNFDPNNYVLVR